MPRISYFSMHAFERNSDFIGDYATLVRVAICLFGRASIRRALIGRALIWRAKIGRALLRRALIGRILIGIA